MKYEKDYVEYIEVCKGYGWMPMTYEQYVVKNDEWAAKLRPFVVVASLMQPV